MLLWDCADSPELSLTLPASWLAAIWVCMALGLHLRLTLLPCSCICTRGRCILQRC